MIEAAQAAGHAAAAACLHPLAQATQVKHILAQPGVSVHRAGIRRFNTRPRQLSQSSPATLPRQREAVVCPAIPALNGVAVRMLNYPGQHQHSEFDYV